MLLHPYLTYNSLYKVGKVHEVLVKCHLSRSHFSGKTTNQELSFKRPLSPKINVTKFLAVYLWERASRISLFASLLKFAYISNMFSYLAFQPTEKWQRRNLLDGRQASWKQQKANWKLDRKAGTVKNWTHRKSGTVFPEGHASWPTKYLSNSMAHGLILLRMTLSWFLNKIINPGYSVKLGRIHFWVVIWNTWESKFWRTHVLTTVNKRKLGNS